MKLTTMKKPFNFKTNDTVVIFVSEDDVQKPSNFLPDEFNFIHEHVDLKYFKGKKSEILFIPFSHKPHVIVCGIGKDNIITIESLRNSASSVISLCRDKEIKDIHVMIPTIKKIDIEHCIESIAEGLYLSNYSFDKYKTKENDSFFVEKIIFCTDYQNSAALLHHVEIISRNVLLCRDLINETSDNSNSQIIADEAKKLKKLNNVTCTVYGKKDIEKMKMGLILAVNRGSKIPPQLVVLKYMGNKKSKKYFAIIGKGITFDSGGINLKPTGHIETMRSDMSGAAAVLYTLKTAAELKLEKNIYAVIPLTDNMLSNDAYRPGDVFKSYNGLTVEIGSTDAEGRLILADAISFTEEKLKPEYIVDIATLTGACLVTFGEVIAAYLSTDENLAQLLEKASTKTDESIWRLPLFSEYDDNLKSDIADLNNISSERYAGTIIGALFLKNFIKNAKWAHIDIAGTSWYSKTRGYRPKNATGFGVRLLFETIKNWD